MKTLSIKFLTVLLSAALFIACGDAADKEQNKNQTADSISTQAPDTEKTAEIEPNFSKFEQYATILSKDELIAQFGEENLEDKVQLYAEGTEEKQTTVLTNPDNGHIVVYVWGEDNQTTSFVEADYQLYNENFEEIGTQKIEAENGLYLGMPLKELKEWNGADFKFSGFGWDYGGSIWQNEGSKLDKSPVKLSLNLLESEDADFAFGDVELNTNDPRLDKLNIVVSEFSIMPAEQK